MVLDRYGISIESTDDSGWRVKADLVGTSKHVNGLRLRTRFFVMHNPKAGPAARDLYHATLLRLQALGASLEVLETTRHGEGMKAAADAARSGRYDAIVAAGGDGTVHDAAEGLIGSSTPLGIIPIGTANVFAREINLPRSPAQLAKALLEGATRNIAVGEANGRPFLFVVGVGFDAEAVRIFERESTRKWGQAGYLWPILRALLAYEDRSIRVVTPKGDAEGQWIVVTRTRRYAGDFVLAPRAELETAAFHVVCLRGSGPWTRARQLAALALGRLDHDPEVSLEVTDRVRIEGDKTIPVEIDGEVLGELPLEIGIHPERLAVIIPS